jgi:AraC-like DNA-binding protein
MSFKKVSINVPSEVLPQSNGSDLHERLCRARRLIDECYDSPLDLKQISQEACLSRFHFLRLFRDTFETTPHQYLIQRRIEKAKELLRSPRLSVTDVCFEVGFESLGSFSALFRRCVGAAPVAYRKRELDSLKKIPGCFIQMYGLGLAGKIDPAA